MKIKASQIELFKDISQIDFDGNYYDLHNDYYCETLSFSEGVLSLSFKSTVGEVLLSLKFINVEIRMIEFFNVEEVNNLTLDNLYRGRAELGGKLIDVSENGKGYFYLEFYEGQKLEFWAENIIIEKG